MYHAYSSMRRILITDYHVSTALPVSNIKVGFRRELDTYPCITIHRVGGSAFARLGNQTVGDGEIPLIEEKEDEVDKGGLYETDLGGEGMARRHSAEFKLEVVRAIESGEKRPAQICQEHRLDPKMVREWRRRYEVEGEEAFRDRGREGRQELAAARRRIADLEGLVGRLTLENEILKKGLGKGQSRLRRGTG